MVFHWSLIDSKSPQILWAFLSILADFNSAVIWMVSNRILISTFSRLFSRLLVSLSSTIIIILIHSFFSSLARFKYLLFHFLLLIITNLTKSNRWYVLFFHLINTRCGLLNLVIWLYFPIFIIISLWTWWFLHIFCLNIWIKFKFVVYKLL